MIQINKNQEINVEALKQEILSRKTTTPRFSLPLTYQQACKALLAAYMAEVEGRCNTFVLDVPTKQHITLAARWLVDNNAKPSLFLCGHCGNGKTTLILAIKSLIHWMCSDESLDEQRYLHIVNARLVTQLAKDKSVAYHKLFDTQLLAIDDLSTEPVEVLEFGNVINPTIDLLMHRYEYRMPTILTSNMSPAEVEANYGNRLADRFREMMTTIPFDNPSYRK